MIVARKLFDLVKPGYITCPKCHQDKQFELLADKIQYDDGVYDMHIGCPACGWVSNELYEYSGYFPDMSKVMMSVCARDLHEQQTTKQEVNNGNR